MPIHRIEHAINVIVTVPPVLIPNKMDVQVASISFSCSKIPV